MKPRLLLDENIPNPLKMDFSADFEVSTVHDRGWASLKNGHLLTAMTEAGIDHLVTLDRNLKNQQNLDKYSIKLIVLRTFDNRYKTLKALVTKIEAGIKSMPAGSKIWEIDLRSN